MQQERNNGSVILGSETMMINQLGTVYAPVSIFQFHRMFTDEQFFVVKLVAYV